MAHKTCLYIAPVGYDLSRNLGGANVTVKSTVALLCNTFDSVVWVGQQWPVNWARPHNLIDSNLGRPEKVWSDCWPANSPGILRYGSLANALFCMIRYKPRFAYHRIGFQSLAVLFLLRLFGVQIISELNKPLSMNLLGQTDLRLFKKRKVLIYESLLLNFSSIVLTDSLIRSKWLSRVHRTSRDKIVQFPNVVDGFHDFRPRDGLLISGALTVGILSSGRRYFPEAFLIDLIKHVRSDENFDIRFRVGISDRLIRDKFVSTFSSWTFVDVYEVSQASLKQFYEGVSVVLCFSDFGAELPHTYSIKHIEAMLSGALVIGNSVGQVNALLSPSTGVVMRRDVRAVGDCLRNLVENRSFRDDCLFRADRGKNLARQLHSLEAVSPRMKDLVRKIGKKR